MPPFFIIFFKNNLVYNKIENRKISEKEIYEKV